MGKTIQAGTTARWWIRSDESPMWNYEGLALVRLGGGPPLEVVNKIDELTKEYGEAPDDLEWGYE